MQYSELIQFESLESVVEIREANQAAKAKQLVSTYVISNEMAERLIHLVFVQLGFEPQSDNKGLLIVGNYGTGKSHLMAVISALAENADLIDALNHPKVAEAAQSIAGHFHVLRTEIGATTMSLRDILTAELETYLNQIEVPFKFPPSDTITNNKDAFEKMMGAFEARYPGQGLLLVVDELLDYLRGRTDQALILDLSFLREIGEMCKELRFRFIAGLQETIFNNQRFEFVANAMRRVKDRFEQVLITRRDIKFVVAERLLKKTVHQKSIIENYLSRFAPYYGNMMERMAEFVSLFPVHPDYIDTFERITLIEKREILKTIARDVQVLTCTSLPESYPGLLTYECYWKTLRENASFRTIPEVREVIECSQVLTDRIRHAFTRPAYKPIAIRIIHALSVHRLSTHDIDAPVGMTAQELRDSLCLYQEGIEELGGNPADDLLSFIKTILREILKTVNRQFISTNAENGQYYIDFKKNYDFDGLIEKRAESLESYQLDRYYYAALKQVMEVSDQPSARHQSFTWAYELEWRSHKVTRQGYLVFGAPDKTTTALSLTDDGFLIYFLPPFCSVSSDQLPVIGSKKEIFLRFTKTDSVFNRIIRLYSAASDLISSASGQAKVVYESKTRIYLRELLQWLQTQKATAIEVTYQGKTRVLSDWLMEVKQDDFRVTNNPALFNPHPSLLINFRDLIDLVADICLENYFLALSPEYPIFPILISHENFVQTAQETLRGIANPSRSKQAREILSALALLDGEQLAPFRSKYAQAILKQLEEKPAGHVLNQTELLSKGYFAPTNYRLEPELLLILIAALVSTGEVVLVMLGQSYDATQLSALAATPIKDLLAFKHLERPKAFNLPALKALFELLALPRGLEIALTKNEPVALQQLQSKVSDILKTLVQAQQALASKFIFWGKAILSKTEMQYYRDNLAQTKTFLESLQSYSTAFKFKNFRYTAGEVTAQWSGLKILKNVTHLQTLLIELSQPIAYLTAAEAALPPQQRWHGEMQQVRETFLSQLSDVRQRNNTGFSYHAQQQLNGLQKSYAKTYFHLHQQARLGAREEKVKRQLLGDKRLLNLKKIVRIALLPRQQLNHFENQLNQLQSCYALSENDLSAHTVCPHCGYTPVKEIRTARCPTLTELSQSLEYIYRQWTKSLLVELENAAHQRDLLKPEARALLDSFFRHRILPENITPAFIQAVQEGLSGLIKVTVHLKDLEKRLQAEGSPVTVAEMQKRFNDYVLRLTKGYELNKVRIVFESD
ncbi:MAG: hypothetical protein KAI83_08875 [Thiomargarita sp.]|nr:hypothetical protein [Thiomargarita sp.]